MSDQEGNQSSTEAARSDGNATGSRAQEDGSDNNNNETEEHYMPKYLKGPIDASRMTLTREEREWARQVKQAIIDHPELDYVSDFLSVQFALVEWESRSLENVLDRAMRLQIYKQEYDVLDTFQQGKVTLEYFIRRNPGYLLHFFLGERYTVVWDLTKFDITCLNDPREMKKIFLGAIYLNHSFSPDFEAIRKGLLWILECEGFMWKAPKMVNSRSMQLGFADVAGNYPYLLDGVVFQNAGVVVNTLVAAVRRYIPSVVHSKFQMGSQNETRMDTICLVPSLEAATDRIVREMTESLRRRFEAEKMFRL